MTQSNNNKLSKQSIQAILESKQSQWASKDRNSLISGYYTNSIAANSPTEDSHIEMVDGCQGFFGVFDGHSGGQTAAYAASNLVPLFQHALFTERTKQLAVIKNTTKGQMDHPLQACLGEPEQVGVAISKESNENKKGALRQLSISGVVASTLHRAFVDHDLSQIQDSLVDGGLSLSGACALLTYVLGDHVFVANAGDCRAVLGHCESNPDGTSRWSAVALSHDHRLDNETEMKRLVTAHPDESDLTKDGRVKGSLMPTRGFGDFVFKLKSLKPVLAKPESLWNPPYITADPEIVQHKIREGDQFIIVASDGLWDKFSNEEAVSLVGNFFQEQTKQNPSSQLSNVCTFLIEKSLSKALGADNEEHMGMMLQLDPKVRRQYHDDITITVIKFNPSNLSCQNSMCKSWLVDTNFPPRPQQLKKSTPPQITQQQLCKATIAAIPTICQPQPACAAPLTTSTAADSGDGGRHLLHYMGVSASSDPLASDKTKITQVRVS